jgi:hypothetical protein
VFLHDRGTGVTERVSGSSDGSEGRGLFPTYPTISADGRYVAFNTHDALAPNDFNSTGDSYLRDRATGTTTWLARHGGGTWDPMISADGRFVTFTGNGLLPDDTTAHIYVTDVITRELTRTSVSSAGEQGDDISLDPPAISADGRYALVQQNGLPRTEITVARFKAERPRPPGRPRGVRMRRRGSRLTVRWAPVAGAAGYVAYVRTRDGRAIRFDVDAGERPRFTVRRLLSSRRLRVSLSALGPDGRPGPATKVRGGARKGRGRR